MIWLPLFDYKIHTMVQSYVPQSYVPQCYTPQCYPQPIIDFLPSHLSLDELVRKAKEKRVTVSETIKIRLKAKDRGKAHINTVYLKKFRC